MTRKKVINNKSRVKKASAKKGGNKGVDDFVSIVVHELKAPLNLTKWNIDLLINKDVGKITAKQKKLLEQINRGNERLLRLITDLLDLSKLQESEFDVHLKSIELSLVISDVIDVFAIQAGSKQIKIKRTGLTDVCPIVMGDDVRLAQVLVNLISNAIKYTPAGGSITVDISRLKGSVLKKLDKDIKTLRISHTDNEPGYLVVAIKDSGRGISLVDQKKLFTRFFRSDDVIDSEIEGTGLGLYITQTIVGMHGGDIWFKSDPGKGSTFYFSLPII